MPSIRNHRGCTLVEALVACGLSVSALATTVLLQGRALMATRAARATSVAALQLSNMVAMVQANAAGWRTHVTVRAPVAPGADCTRQPCTAAQLAGLELARWQRALARALPGAGGDVCCVREQCVVAVRWSGRSMQGVVATGPDGELEAPVAAQLDGVGAVPGAVP